MRKRLQHRRLVALASLLGAAFLCLAYRLVDLQVLRHSELRVKAEQNTQREFFIQPRRGDILDVKGNLLAASIFVKRVCADPTLLGNRQAEVARVIAPLLKLSEADLIQKLTPRVRQNEKGKTITNGYVVLQQKVSAERWQNIQKAMSELSFGMNEKKLPPKQQAFYRNLRKGGIFADSPDDQLRVYPSQSLAAHVLGYVGINERPLNGRTNQEIVGKEGIEFKMNSQLSGVRGWRVTEKDSHSREVVSLREQNVEPRDGFNVVLTIDAVIQHITESALADAMEKYSPVSITGLVIRPETGEIIAMATLPNFDPNNLAASTPDTRRNRVIADQMEPGSTFKIVVVSGALSDQLVRLTDVFDCEHGHFSFAGRVLHDHESYDNLSVKDIITKSSNIGAAKIGIKMGQNRLYEHMQNYGFGSPTGIPLRGEIGGTNHPLKNWTKVSIAQIPMGHGVAVTRLQMAMAMCAIANDGWLMRPMLINRLEDRQGNVVARYSPERLRQVIKEPAARLMIEALKTVVATNGTARDAALEHYTVAGKTGTAQKPVAGGYSNDKFVSSFMGFFPADNPQLCIAIVMDEPDMRKGHYGGQICSPVFKTIAESAANYLNIRPDINDEKSEPVVAASNDVRATKTVSRTQ